MSASYVRATFRQFAATVAAAQAVPFYDTINVSVEPTDPVWWTCQFQSEYFEGTFCQREYQETGFITVVVMAQPGLGDVQAIDAIERLTNALMSEVDPTQRLVLVSHDPVDEGTAGDADASYRVVVNINYKHSM